MLHLIAEPSQTDRANHPACAESSIAGWAFERHGAALLDGADAIERGDSEAAGVLFAAAVRELARVASDLSCMTVGDVQAIDAALALYWERLMDGYYEGKGSVTKGNHSHLSPTPLIPPA